jgi:hypothetical protein
MNILGRTCFLIISFALIVVCFFLGIVTLFVGVDPFWENINVYRNTAWSIAEPTGASTGMLKRWCNASCTGRESTERAVMVAMTTLGFIFLFFFLLFTPCLMIDKVSGKKGMALCGCAGGCGFLSWVFYLVAWAYWLAIDPLKEEPILNGRKHIFGPGFICAVTLWCLLTLALAGVCGGARMKKK